jgi:pyruvate dehydrogenase (quinone)
MCIPNASPLPPVNDQKGNLSMSRTAAEFLVEALEKTGVKRVYGVVGDSLNGFTDAMRRRKSIDWIHMRHEEAGAFAAGAEAHLTGSLAVCAGSCGPGNLHLINGLFDCQRSGVPVLAIAAHIPSTEIGIDYFQATHPENLFKDCSHYVELVSNPALLPQILKRAIRVAIAKRGVAVIVLPGDVALMKIDTPVPNWLVPSVPVVRPDVTEIGRLAELLNGSSRVTMLCGAGCAGAHAEVVELARKLKAPIVHSFRGKEHLEYENPYDVGMTGLVGFASGYNAIKSCDTLLMLGTDFPYRAFYPDHARIAQVDIRPEALGNRCALDIGLLGSVKDTLEALLPSIKERHASDHLDTALADYKAARKNLDALAESGPNSNIIHPQYVTRLVSEMASEDAVFTCDVGTPIIWTARYLKMNGKRRIIGSFNHGSMANAMLQAIGAQTAYPGRQVISLSGDGGFTMMMGDFITLTQMGLPVKVVVLNNGTLGFVEMEMKATGFLDTGCDLKNPNFAAMAEATGVRGIRVEKPQELKGAIEAMLAHKGPVLLDVVSARQELAMPPKTTFGQAYHFGMFMMAAVLDGRATQLIDLAKVNLTR